MFTYQRSMRRPRLLGPTVDQSTHFHRQMELQSAESSKAIRWFKVLTTVCIQMMLFWDMTYEVCPESMRPFWISQEPVAWPWCNLAASQRRPYCASVNSHSPVGLVSRQWDTVDWACVLCDRRIHNDRASRSASSRQCACPFYSSRAGFFFLSLSKASHHPGLSARFGSLRLLAFPRAKIAVESGEICECDGHTVHQAQSMASHCRLTNPMGEWLFIEAE